MSEAEFWEAEEIEPMARELIHEYHRHLWEGEAEILYLFTSKERKSKGRIVLGTAQLTNPLQRYFTRERVHGEADFILIFDHMRWRIMEPEQRKALVDHELCHCIQNIKGEWAIRGHDLEEFTEIVQRHGLWKTDVAAMAKAMQPYQHELPLDEPSDGAMDAARKLVGTIGKDGITGMSLSSGGTTVTIGDMGDPDELLDRARSLAASEASVSVSMLQRKLRINFARAARLIDALEAEGVIGKPN